MDEIVATGVDGRREGGAGKGMNCLRGRIDHGHLMGIDVCQG